MPWWSRPRTSLPAPSCQRGTSNWPSCLRVPSRTEPPTAPCHWSANVWPRPCAQVLRSSTPQSSGLDSWRAHRKGRWPCPYARQTPPPSSWSPPASWWTLLSAAATGSMSRRGQRSWRARFRCCGKPTTAVPRRRCSAHRNRTGWWWWPLRRRTQPPWPVPPAGAISSWCGRLTAPVGLPAAPRRFPGSAPGSAPVRRALLTQPGVRLVVPVAPGARVVLGRLGRQRRGLAALCPAWPQPVLAGIGCLSRGIRGRGILFRAQPVPARSAPLPARGFPERPGRPSFSTGSSGFCSPK